ncbi:MAG: acetyl-CoA acetyltransferase [Halieaceae bacterium]
MTTDKTPVIVGVGQFTEHLDSADYSALPPQHLAARAATAALADTGVDGLAEKVDCLAAVPLVADSVADKIKPLVAPFGAPDLFPCAVTHQLGMSPAATIYSAACGNEPQRLVAEMGEAIARGDHSLVILCGAEAAASQRHAQRNGQTLDWTDHSDGTCEVRDPGFTALQTQHMADNGLIRPVDIYPLFEHARRARLEASRDEYSAQMGALFARYNKVAVDNAFAMSRKALSADDIATVSPGNRLIADPYPKHMVARDGVNQAAAVLMTSVGRARELGIDESQWVYLHGHADTKEKGIGQRPDLGASPAMVAAYRTALSRAGLRLDEVSYFDLYSCFPIAVFSAMDGLGLSIDDPRPFTVTGGLPFFGGPGNNYSMHAIASMIEQLRRDPGSFGVVGANGGFLSKHSAGVYSTTPVTSWQPFDSGDLQQQLDDVPATPFTERPNGEAVVETYTVMPGPQGYRGVVVGRLAATNERFLAVTDPEDTGVSEMLEREDLLGVSGQVSAMERGNRFRFG